MKEQLPSTADERKRRRRRFGILAAALGALLLLAGTQFANRGGVLEAVGIVSLAYGVGLLVAGARTQSARPPQTLTTAARDGQRRKH